MSEVIKPIRGMSVCKFDGLDFEYKKHRVQVFVGVECDPTAYSYLALHVDDVYISVWEIGDGSYLFDDWCNYSDEPEHALDDPAFYSFVKEIVDLYLKEVV
jgi:hypothetical protein